MKNITILFCLLFAFGNTTYADFLKADENLVVKSSQNNFSFSEKRSIDVQTLLCKSTDCIPVDTEISQTFDLLKVEVLAKGHYRFSKKTNLPLVNSVLAEVTFTSTVAGKTFSATQQLEVKKHKTLRRNHSWKYRRWQAWQRKLRHHRLTFATGKPKVNLNSGSKFPNPGAESKTVPGITKPQLPVMGIQENNFPSKQSNQAAKIDKQNMAIIKNDRGQLVAYRLEPLPQNPLSFWEDATWVRQNLAPIISALLFLVLFFLLYKSRNHWRNSDRVPSARWFVACYFLITAFLYAYVLVFPEPILFGWSMAWTLPVLILSLPFFLSAVIGIRKHRHHDRRIWRKAGDEIEFIEEKLTSFHNSIEGFGNSFSNIRRNIKRWAHQPDRYQAMRKWPVLTWFVNALLILIILNTIILCQSRNETAIIYNAQQIDKAKDHLIATYRIDYNRKLFNEQNSFVVRSGFVKRPQISNFYAQNREWKLGEDVITIASRYNIQIFSMGDSAIEIWSLRNLNPSQLSDVTREINEAIASAFEINQMQAAAPVKARDSAIAQKSKKF